MSTSDIVHRLPAPGGAFPRREDVGVDRERIRRITQIALLVIAVVAASGAAWRYVASREGNPALGEDDPQRQLEITPASGPVGTRPVFELRGWEEGTSVRVLLCTVSPRPEGSPPGEATPPPPPDCAELASGQAPGRVAGEPVPGRLPGGTEVVPGTYAVRAGPGEEPPQVGEFRVVPFEIAAAPEPRSYAGTEVSDLGLGEPRAVARNAPCGTGFTPDGRLVIGRTVVDPATGVTVQFPIEGSELVWSPTGERLAFITPDRKEIHMAEPSGEGAVAVVREARGIVSSLTWSPEGDRIAYVARSEPGVRLGPGPSTVFVFHLVTGETTELGRGEAVAWSPTAERLVVEAPGGTLELSDLEGARTRLTEGSRPAWSPDGSLVGFLRLDGEAGGAWVIGTDGGEPRRWIPSGVCGTAFSSDGRRLAVVSAEGELTLRSITAP